MRHFLCALLLAVFFSSSPALAEVQPFRPVVLVPGILGSRLCDSSENVIWGNKSSLSNFHRLEITGLAVDTPLKPCGVVKDVQLIGRFWSIDQYNLLLASLKEAGFDPQNHKLFVFDYDWRQSNFYTAGLLDKFVKTNIGLDEPFDIIAHSMGGIVSRIYLEKYPTAKFVKRIIYMGTPFLGSMNTFGTIQEGWGWVQNQLAG